MHPLIWALHMFSPWLAIYGLDDLDFDTKPIGTYYVSRESEVLRRLEQEGLRIRKLSLVSVPSSLSDLANGASSLAGIPEERYTEANVTGELDMSVVEFGLTDEVIIACLGAE